MKTKQEAFDGRDGEQTKEESLLPHGNLSVILSAYELAMTRALSVGLVARSASA